MTDFVIAESAIRQLHARWLDAIWRMDAKAFADCFAKDGEWKIAGMHAHGRAEIEGLFGKLLGALRAGLHVGRHADPGGRGGDRILECRPLTRR